MLCGCDLALLDEPFVGLDRVFARYSGGHAGGKIEREGWACLLVTHDRFEAARLSREILRLAPKGMGVEKTILLPEPLSVRGSAYEEAAVAREFGGIRYYE